MRAAILAGLALAGTATVADASAWTQPKGKGQVIVKYETLRASQGYDQDGILRSLPDERREEALTSLTEFGLTDTLTLQVKAEWQSGEDAFVDYQGRGPLEIGVTWQAWRNENSAVGLYAGYALAGEGRNAGYEAPDQGVHDVEVRASVGHGWSGNPRRREADRSYVELQVARRWRQGLEAETRLDLTYGQLFGENWLLLNQVYAGQVDDEGARWATIETSVVRRFGDWRVQAGWRESLAGRETPDATGLVFGVWRRF